MRLLFTVMLLSGLAACQVTTSQSLGGGITIRSSHPIGGDQALEGQASAGRAAEENDEEAPEDRAPDVTIGGGFGAGVSR